MSVGGVGAIGGMGCGTIGATGGIGAGGLNGPLGDMNAAALSAASGTRMDQLMQLLDGFSSAEILIALMLSGASGHHDRKHGHDNDAALGFLAGLALASQLGQCGMQCPQSVGAAAATPAATGLALDASA